MYLALGNDDEKTLADRTHERPLTKWQGSGPPNTPRLLAHVKIVSGNMGLIW